MNARLKVAGALGALALAAVPAGAGAVSLPADTTAILSGTPDLFGAFATPLDGSLIENERAVSRDGGRVVFSSGADGLSGEDDDAVQNVYVKDMASGAVQLVSRGTGEHGEPAHATCGDAAISADGHQVAFTCGGPLDPGDTNGKPDVYVRNLDTQVTTLVSRVPGGAVGDRASDQPAIAVSGGTTFVAFSSRASDLLGGAPLTDAPRVYRAAVNGGNVSAVALASENGNPGAQAGGSDSPSISDDGSRVAFSTGDALDAADAGSDTDVYVRDFTTSTTIFASRRDGAGGAGVDGTATDPAISGDGTAVAFTAFESLDPAHDLQPSSSDVYLRSLSAGRTTLVSAKADGSADGGSFAPSIDTDGRTVAFRSTSGALTPDSLPGRNGAYVFRAGAGVRLVGRADGGFALHVALSGDGTQIALPVDPLDDATLVPDVEPGFIAVVLHDLVSGVNRTVSRPPGAAPFVNAGGGQLGGALSADGRFAAFVSSAPALGAASGLAETFVRDLATGAVTPVSAADFVKSVPQILGEFDPPAISADGRRVAFAAFTPNGEQVFVRDLAAGSTFPVSVADGLGGALGNGDSVQPSISGDGQRVVFASEASNLTANDRDAGEDIFVRDLATGRTTLLDVVGGTAAKAAGSTADTPSISGDGRSVAFVSNASLDPAIATIRGVRNAFVHRLDSGTTVLASVAGAATLADRDSSNPSIDRDGNRVSFVSAARTLGAPAGTDQLYVRDLAAKTLTVAGRADGAAGALLPEVGTGVLSADGQHVAFAARASAPVAPGDPGDGSPRVYERDLASSVTRLVSRRSGAGGAPLAPGPDALVDNQVNAVGITADGGCVTFDTPGALLPGQSFSDFGNVYVRAVSSNCGRPDPTPVVPGPGGGGGTPAAVLSKLALKPARFHVGGRRGGTKISFRLDRAASVTLAFDRLLPGRRAKAKKVHGRKGKLGPCSTKRRHGGVRCTVVKRFGRLVLAQSKVHAGANTVRFSGRIGRKALAPGRYRLTATPLHGKARTVTFTVVKAPRAHKRKARR